MSPRFVLGRENVPCVAEVVNRSLKADCTDFTHKNSNRDARPIFWGLKFGQILFLGGC